MASTARLPRPPPPPRPPARPQRLVSLSPASLRPPPPQVPAPRARRPILRSRATLRPRPPIKSARPRAASSGPSAARLQRPNLLDRLEPRLREVLVEIAHRVRELMDQPRDVAAPARHLVGRRRPRVGEREDPLAAVDRHHHVAEDERRIVKEIHEMARRLR